jgi:hypothetical protein
MSSVPARLAIFAVVLAGLFALGALAGGLVDADAPGGDDADGHDAAGTQKASGERAGGHDETGSGKEGAEHGTSRSDSEQAGHGGSDAKRNGEPEADSQTEGDDHGGHGGERADPVRGLAIAEHGKRLVVEDVALRRGAPEQLRFRIVGEDGRALRRFDVEHTKRMHVIVVRRDLTGFQHLHPTMRGDGTWTVPLRIDRPGSYRVFADFSVDGEATTLAGDLRVDGAATLRELPAPTRLATSDGGYEVERLGGHPHPGEEADLRFRITQDGRPVKVERYLGAGGHLVALREGDLAYLHVHPTDERANEIGFGATFPTAGRYGLFLQFKVDGRVQTVAFTEEVR